MLDLFLQACLLVAAFLAVVWFVAVVLAVVGAILVALWTLVCSILGWEPW